MKEVVGPNFQDDGRDAGRDDLNSIENQAQGTSIPTKT